MPEWTLDDIARQAARGGVNRQQAEELLRTIHMLDAFLDRATKDVSRWKARWFHDNFAFKAEVDDLLDAIIAHRNVFAETLDPQRRKQANEGLWRLVDRDGRHAQEWQTGEEVNRG